MSNELVFEEPEFNLVATSEEDIGTLEPDTPFRILLVGDWSGRAGRIPLSAPSKAPAPVLIDRDNFDEVLAKFGVEIQLALAGDQSRAMSMTFGELDDFHPDRIYERLDVFESLKETRKRLGDPATFASAAEEVRLWTVKKDTQQERLQSKPAEADPLPVQAAPDPASGSLLDAILDRANEGDSGTAVQPRGPGDLESLLRDVVGPYLSPPENPERAELIAAVDEAAAALMRVILHRPEFQAIESAWRGAYFLTSRLETGTQLKLYLLDMSKAELRSDVSDNQETKSKLFKLLFEETVGTPGAEPWALIGGNYTFDQSTNDVELLRRIAKIAQAAGAPFVAAASPHMLGCDSPADLPDPDAWRVQAGVDTDRWKVLRHSPEASYLGLALPRFLLRLPYGEDSDPIEQFEFEELTELSNHEEYLWCNPAFACAYFLGQAFSEYEWDFQPGIVQELEGLPLHVYEQEGESRIKPCAEVVMTVRAAEAILDRGMMPLICFKGSDSVRLARWQSITSPPTALSGRWG
jgi:type VI secretion system protein ImpC